MSIYTAIQAASKPTDTAGVKDVTKALSQVVASGGNGNTVNHLNSVWSRFFKSLYSETLAVWPHVLTGVFILLVFWIIARIVRFSMHQVAKRSKRRREVYYLLSKCINGAILMVGFITALGTMGVNITALVTSLGLTGFAVGLALKDPISNAIAGFMVLFYEPFHVGDTINFSGNEGVVKDIQLRYTILLTDGKRFLIPNSNLLTNVITVNDKTANS